MSRHKDLEQFPVCRASCDFAKVMCDCAGTGMTSGVNPRSKVRDSDYLDNPTLHKGHDLLQTTWFQQSDDCRLYPDMSFASDASLMTAANNQSQLIVSFL